MAALGLVRGSSGNVSVRRGDILLITPSGIPYERIHASQVVAIDLEGRPISGGGVPSSEWRMHVSIYRARGDVRAIVHTHSPAGTAAAAVLPALPVPNDEGTLIFGEAVPVSRHAPPGTWDLAQAVVEALGEKGKAALIARHGTVAVGRTLVEALLLAEKLEEVATVFFFSKTEAR